MVDDTLEPDEEPVREWSDAEFQRAVALMLYTAAIEDADGDARSPDYDW